MERVNKDFIFKSVIVIVLLCACALCNRAMDYLGDSDHVLNIFWGLLRSFIYISLYITWGISVKERIVSKQVRRYLIIVSFLLVFWISVRSMKYYFVTVTNMCRYLWYMYYIPMLFIPLMSLFNSITLRKSEKYKLPKWCQILFIYTLVLVLLVLTNDFHQLVFTFPEDAIVFSDEDHGYGILYPFVLGSEIVFALLSVAIMLIKTRRPKTKDFIWFPFVPTLIAIIYGISYIAEIRWIRELLSDLTVFQCLMFTAAFESCIQCGLIQSNTNYKKLFNISSLPVIITDRNYQVYSTSKDATIPSLNRMKEENQNPLINKEGIRLSKNKITAGYVFWSEDISKITEVLLEINDLNESLNEKVVTTQEETRTEQERIRLEEANRLYNYMQLETAGHLNKMQQLINEFSITENKKEEKRILHELLILGAYFKRRNNLLFISETQKMIRPSELDYCLKESMGNLELSGIKNSYSIEINEELSLFDMIDLYDKFESVIEKTIGRLLSIVVMIKEIEDSLLMIINICLNEQVELEFDSCFEVEEEDDHEFCLSYSLERKKS